MLNALAIVEGLAAAMWQKRGAGMLSALPNLMDQKGEIDRTFKTGIGFTFEQLGDAGICAVCR